MAAQLYRLSFDVPASRVSTVLELLGDEVDNINMQPCGIAAPTAAPAKRRESPLKHYNNTRAGGTFIKGLQSSDGMATMQVMEAAFAASGLAPASAHSAASKLHRAGFISIDRTVKPVVYRLTEKGRQ